MYLEAENKIKKVLNSFSEVEAILRELRSYGPTSFAILSKPDGSYVQVAGGRVNCLLEFRSLNSNKNMRAYLAQPKSPFTEIQTLICGAGHIQHQPDETLFIDDVIACFAAFFDGRDFPSEVFWREI